MTRANLAVFQVVRNDGQPSRRRGAETALADTAGVGSGWAFTLLRRALD